MADDLMGAMKEAHALSLGTKCKQFLFSVSLNPPAGESVRIEVFEKACDVIEERLGLKGHPLHVNAHNAVGDRPNGHHKCQTAKRLLHSGSDDG